MSGAEIIGLISSVVAILDAVKTVYESLKDTRGLPQAFREVDQRLPLVQDILRTAERQINDGNPDEESCNAMKRAVELCRDKAERLETLFQKVALKSDASILERYRSAVRMLRKGNRVEVLMRGILEDVQLLAGDRAIKGATEAQVAKLGEAINDLSTISSSSSLPDESSFHMYDNSGSGPQIINSGTGIQNNNTGSGYQITGSIQTLNIVENTPDKDLSEILDQLFITHADILRSQLLLKKGDITPGTCQWLLTHQVYRDWLNGSSSQLLWISGGPGKGKTMLAIYLTKELERSVRERGILLFSSVAVQMRNAIRPLQSCVICHISSSHSNHTLLKPFATTLTVRNRECLPRRTLRAFGKCLQPCFKRLIAWCSA
ncbi:hypothetical protein VTN77DRAFT_6253 [Rasamsonia byssochlamydoides]|uniref:uncharacterized protein n=1 Tax=Rasamsonia byssochlamydoides TaxID=89139 RepID=UPI003742B2D4